MKLSKENLLSQRFAHDVFLTTTIGACALAPFGVPHAETAIYAGVGGLLVTREPTEYPDGTSQDV